MASAIDLSLVRLPREVPLCEGYDDFAHRVFVTTNEQDTERTLRILSKKPPAGNTIIAVSGLFALNLAAIRETKRGVQTVQNLIVLDRSKRVEDFWAEINMIVLSSKDRVAAKGKIIELIDRKKEMYFSGSIIKMPKDTASEEKFSFNLEITQGYSWLSTDAYFRKIQRIFQEKRFVFLRVDLLDPLHELKLAFERRKIRIDTLYLSNVLEYGSENQDVLRYAVAITGLIHPETFFIHTKPRTLESKFLVQKVYRIKNTEDGVSVYEQIRQIVGIGILGSEEKTA